MGRLGRLADGVAQFSGGLANTCTLADLKLARLLARFDEAAELLPDAHRNALEPPHRPDPTPVPTAAPTALDLAAAGITTVVWATGLRPDHGWVELPVFDHAGRIRHTGGVVDGAPGVYVLGLPALRTRRSSYIAGAAGDTAELADHLATLCNGLATTTLGAPAQPAHRLSSRVAGSSSPEPVGHRSRAGSLRGA